MKRSLNKTVPRPDFNIGTDNFHAPKRLITSVLLKLYLIHLC